MMDARLVVIVAELPKLSLEVLGVPEGDMVKELAPDSADQPFNERVRHRYQGYRLDGGDFKDAKVRLPAMELEERVVIGTQGCRTRVRSGKDPIEHAADALAIENPGVSREADDSPRVLIHDRHDPVAAQEQGFAAKEIQAPKAILRVPEE